jgi:glutamyl-tRNA reductase
MLGAGEMGAGVAGALRFRNVSDLCIANRTPARAEHRPAP